MTDGEIETKELRRAKREKYVTVALCIMTVMVTLGFASSTKSLFPDEIAKELNVSRSAVVVGDSLRYIATAVVNIFFGALIARFGEKKLICVGFASLIASMLLYATATSLIPIYIGGVLLGIGFSQTTTAMVGYVVGKRFTTNKGTVMGVILASNGLGGAIAIRLVGGLIDPTVTGSYRRAYFVIAAVLTVAAIIMLIFYREKASDGVGIGKKTPKKLKGGSDWVGIPLSEAKRKFCFWGALICIFLSGAIIQGTHSIVAMHYKDVGIDYGSITWLLSFSSVILAGTKMAAGICYDRFGLRLTAGVCTVISVISSFLLAFTTGNGMGTTLAIIYTVIAPFAMPLETVMLPIYASELFGNHSYSRILGIFVSVNTAGFAVGAPIMNLCYDIFGSYKYALITVGAVMCAVFILLQTVITSSKKLRKTTVSE